MVTNNFHRVWANIDLDAVRDNIAAVKGRIKSGTKICAVIKADGYGHGAVPIARHTQSLVDFFAVATIEEALELRSAGIERPILILGYVHPDSAVEAVQNDIRLTVFDYDTAAILSQKTSACGRQLKIHIKIDTGMNRIGLKPDENSLQIIEKIVALKGLQAEGIFTHFFASDSSDPASARHQLSAFQDFCGAAEKRGIHIPMKHCSNSAAAIVMPEANLDMVRLGIVIYGLYPSEYIKQLPLKPALSLKSSVVMVKTIQKGETVGYGATYTAKNEMKIATVPVGYADGYMRSLSNRGYVLIRGQRAKIVGRICMDQFMVDVTSLDNIRRGDEVTLIGQDGTQELSMEQVASMAGSFNYEFVCDINKRVPRLYFSGGMRVF